VMNSEKNILVHLKNNPLICDCRHHWIGIHKAETELHFKDANCEANGQSILLKNFALCEKQPLLDPFGDVYKKCCRQIQYKNKPPAGSHETVLITETDHHSNHHSDRLIEKTSVSKTHHNDLKQIKEEVQVKHVDVPVLSRIVEHVDTSVKRAPVISRVEHIDTTVKHQPVVSRVVEHIDTSSIKHSPVISRTEHVDTIVKHQPVISRVVEHVDTSVKHTPILTRVDHVDTTVKQPVISRVVEHVDTGSVKHAHVDKHLHSSAVEHHHEQPEISTQILTNQRLVTLPQKLHRLLSPAVLVKKPLKYRRLVSTQPDQPIRYPVHHVMVAESSVPHVSLVKLNGDTV